MATLTVEGIPPGLLARLAQAAEANGRCVNSEVILSIVRHVRDVPSPQDLARTRTIACPLGSWFRSEAPHGLHVSWGDPGDPA